MIALDDGTKICFDDMFDGPLFDRLSRIERKLDELLEWMRQPPMLVVKGPEMDPADQVRMGALTSKMTRSLEPAPPVPCWFSRDSGMQS